MRVFTKTVDIAFGIRLLTIAAVATLPSLFSGRADARVMRCDSGQQCRVKTIYDRQGGDAKIKSIKITAPPANGTARGQVVTLSTGTGKNFKAGEIYYKSKPGFVGSDSFSYQTVRLDGSTGNNFTITVAVR